MNKHIHITYINIIPSVSCAYPYIGKLLFFPTAQ